MPATSRNYRPALAIQDEVHEERTPLEEAFDAAQVSEEHHHPAAR